jgi:hypothetical protein
MMNDEEKKEEWKKNGMINDDEERVLIGKFACHLKLSLISYKMVP